MKTIIFVCHGNICRSPAVEWLFNKYIKELHLEDKFKVVSRSLSYEEIGNDIYPPMKRELKRRNIPFERHYANIITEEDYDLADYIFYMDDSNRYIIERMFNDSRHIIHPIYMFTPDIKYIEDPWYTDRFEHVVNLIDKCVQDILKNI